MSPEVTETWVHGINNNGVAVGAYLDQAAVCHGFILSQTRFIRLDDPSGTCTDAYNLNPKGSVAVAGSYYTRAGSPRGFMYKNGKFTDVSGPAGSKISMANGINDNGDVVGVYIDAGEVTHGFLLSGGKYTTLDVPGAGFSDAMGINNTSHIVLCWIPSGGGPYNSSIYDGKTFRTINVPDAQGSIATS